MRDHRELAITHFLCDGVTVAHVRHDDRGVLTAASEANVKASEPWRPDQTTATGLPIVVLVSPVGNRLTWSMLPWQW